MESTSVTGGNTKYWGGLTWCRLSENQFEYKGEGGHSLHLEFEDGEPGGWYIDHLDSDKNVLSRWRHHEVGTAHAAVIQGLQCLQAATAISSVDLEMMLLSALRYALGRRSYITSATAEWVRRYWNQLSPAFQGFIIRDLREELERYERMGMTLGEQVDHDGWVKLLRVLEEKR